MHPVNRHIASLLLTATLVVPAAIKAAPVPQEASVNVRVYDKDHKDYHHWDHKENQAWGLFLTENHHKHYEYSKANSKQQEQYWNWRHAHPDKD
jgi:hypothetical protein